MGRPVVQRGYVRNPDSSAPALLSAAKRIRAAAGVRMNGRSIQR